MTEQGVYTVPVSRVRREVATIQIQAPNRVIAKYLAEEAIKQGKVTPEWSLASASDEVVVEYPVDNGHGKPTADKGLAVRFTKRGIDLPPVTVPAPNGQPAEQARAESDQRASAARQSRKAGEVVLLANRAS